jgi:hypothetical protein
MNMKEDDCVSAVALVVESETSAPVEGVEQLEPEAAAEPGAEAAAEPAEGDEG